MPCAISGDWLEPFYLRWYFYPIVENGGKQWTRKQIRADFTLNEEQLLRWCFYRKKEPNGTWICIHEFIAGTFYGSSDQEELAWDNSLNKDVYKPNSYRSKDPMLHDRTFHVHVPGWRQYADGEWIEGWTYTEVRKWRRASDREITATFTGEDLWRGVICTAGRNS